MAATYKVGDAFNLLLTKMKTPDLSPFAATICDEALSEIWNAYDWRGSLAELPPFYLQALEQDYGPPLSAVPSDFGQLREAWYRDVHSNCAIQDLAVRANLKKTDRTGMPEDISYEPEVISFRVYPMPGSGMQPNRYQIEGRYKKRHTKVVTTNINSLVLPWDDQYFYVYRRVLHWKALEEIGSPLAGQITYYPDGSVAANGAAASAWNAVQEMVRREGGADAPENLAPSEELAM